MRSARTLGSLAIGLVLGLVAVLSAGCPESKEPMHADNPNADPMMLEAGGPIPQPDTDAAMPPAETTSTPAPSTASPPP